jgi:hypothetical protein
MYKWLLGVSSACVATSVTEIVSITFAIQMCVLPLLVMLLTML